MSREKRGRGRPPGSGKDDAPVLDMVADMVTAAPMLRPTTAMRRAAPKATDADIRRFQAKWKGDREALLARARGRAEARRAARPSSGQRHGSGAGLTALGHVAQQMERDARRMRELSDHPAMRAARDLENNPGLKAARDALKATSDLENSATMRALRDFDGPTMRAIRQYQAMIDRLRRGY